MHANIKHDWGAQGTCNSPWGRSEKNTSVLSREHPDNHENRLKNVGVLAPQTPDAMLTSGGRPAQQHVPGVLKMTT